MSERPEERTQVFFLSYKDEVQKVSGVFVTNTEQLKSIFAEKFGKETADSTGANTSFYIEDQQYHVKHKLEDFSEIYDGAIIEVRVKENERRRSRSRSPQRRDTSSSSSGRSRSRSRGGSAHTRKQPEQPPAAPAFVDDGMHIVRLYGLPWTVRKEDIEQFFGGLEIVDNGVFITLNQQGQSTGEAFAQFKDEASCRQALLRDHQYIGSRYVEVFQSTDVERFRAMQRSRPWQPANPSSAVVRLHGLPFAANEDDIRQFLSGVNAVAVHLVLDNQGRSVGDAFVELPSDAEGSKALACHRKTMGSRYIEVFNSNMAEMTTAISVGASRPRGRHSQRDAYVSESSQCVHMKGLPFNATESEITQFFAEVGVVPLRIHRKEGGGEAFVEFSSTSDAARAMMRHKAYIGRRYIELDRVGFNDLCDAVGLPRLNAAAATTMSAPLFNQFVQLPSGLDVYTQGYRDIRDFNKPF